MSFVLELWVLEANMFTEIRFALRMQIQKLEIAEVTQAAHWRPVLNQEYCSALFRGLERLVIADRVCQMCMLMFTNTCPSSVPPWKCNFINKSPTDDVTYSNVHICLKYKKMIDRLNHDQRKSHLCLHVLILLHTLLLLRVHNRKLSIEVEKHSLSSLRFSAFDRCRCAKQFWNGK